MRFASSCLHGAPAGDPQICVSDALGTQAPSGPRQPAPPLQPQPWQRQASSAKTGDMAKSENRMRTIGMARMGRPPSLALTPSMYTFCSRIGRGSRGSYASFRRKPKSRLGRKALDSGFRRYDESLSVKLKAPHQLRHMAENFLNTVASRGAKIFAPGASMLIVSPLSAMSIASRLPGTLAS